MATETAHRGRGRPLDLEKRRAILDAAGALFLERGIAATSMELVAARAAVSKMTVYAHFPHKPALLAAVFERNIKAIRLPELADERDLASSIEGLIAFGVRLTDFLTRPEIVRSGLLMAASADEHPQLAAAFYAAGPQAMTNKVAAFLGSLDRRGFLSLKDPELAAEQLCSAWLGVSRLRQSLGIAGPPSAEAIERSVRFATRTMLSAWARERGGRA